MKEFALEILYKRSSNSRKNPHREPNSNFLRSPGVLLLVCSILADVLEAEEAFCVRQNHIPSGCVMDRGGWREARGGWGDRGGGRGRGGEDRRNQHPHHQLQQRQSGRGGGSSQWRNQGREEAPPSQNVVQQRQVGARTNHPGGQGTGFWGRGTTFSQVVPQRSFASPQQAPDPVVPAMKSLTLSEQLPCSSSSEQNMDRLQLIKRPDRGTNVMREVRLRVNHFPVDFPSGKKVWHYDVEIKPQEPPRNGRPWKIPKFTLSMIRKELSSDNPENFPSGMTIYDGERNIYSAVELPTREFVVKLFEVSYIVVIKLVCGLNYSELKDYFSGNGRVVSVPRDILQAMDLALKENPKRYAIPFQFHPGDDLGRGIVASREPRYRLKPTSQGLALVLDYSVLPFSKPIPVLDFLKEHINGFTINQFGAFQNQVSNALKGLKVTKTYFQDEQRHVIAGLTKSAREISFTTNDFKGNAPPKNVTLVDYFRDKYKKEIMYKDIPCLDLGRNNFVPLEFCEIADRQRYPKENLDGNAAKKLKGLSLVPPKDREKTICDLVRAENGPCGGGIAQNFGIAVNTTMTKVIGRVISPPELKIGVPGAGWTRIRLHSDKCDWNLVKKCVVKGKQIERWAVLDFTCSEFGFHRFNADQFIPKLIDRCEALGIRMRDPLYKRAAMNQLNNVDTISELLESMKKECHLEFILCVMSKKHRGYNYLKWISETRVGIITQCCLLTHNVNDQYLALLALSINAKLGGTNMELLSPLPGFEAKDHVMFIGADVNHPGSKASPYPSIAAVVASMNWPAPNHYPARIRPQDPRTEMIQDFREMCLELLESYVKVNKVMPDKIVIFRDGVSEGQFDMVLNEELSCLKRAFRAMNYYPTITLVVAQKRHLTRFFPESYTGNVPPGTVH